MTCPQVIDSVLQVWTWSFDLKDKVVPREGNLYFAFANFEKKEVFCLFVFCHY